MEFKTLSIESDGPVRIVRLNRPQALNSLSVTCLRELTRVFSEIHRDARVRAVVLTGTDKFFSAGMDLKDEDVARMRTGSLDDRLDLVKAGPEACQAIEDCRPVVIAAWEGFCIGGGVSLVISCDFRIMAQSAFVRIPEVDLGLNYSWGSIPRLVHLVGPAKAKEAVILCDQIPAEKCRAWGLAEEVVPDGGAFEAGLNLARRIAAKPPLPVAMTKESVNRVAAALDRTGVYMDADQFLLTTFSEDHAEGLAAFFEKRAGQFKGS